MKKSGKTSIIVAVVLVVIGLFIGGIGFAMSGFDPRKLSTVSYDRIEKVINPQDITSIYANIKSEDIEIVYKDIDEIRVTYYDNKYEEYEISTRNDQLWIQFEDNRPWYKHIGVFIGKMDCDIVVEVPRNLKLDIEVNSRSGCIYVDGLITGKLDIETSSGDVELKNITSDILIMETTSGSVEANDLSIGSITAESTSGDVELNNCYGDKLLMDTVSGSVDFHKIEYSDITLSSTSGDIEGTIVGSRQEYSISSETTSGDNNLGNYDYNGTKSLKVSTTSGDIEIDFK